MSDIKTQARGVVKFLAPHGLALADRERRQKKADAANARRREDEVRQREERLTAVASDGAVPYDFEDSMAFLVAIRGLDPEHVKYGSIPLASLEESRRAVREELPQDRALVGLHVGNFVGVSLAYMLDVLVTQNPASVVLSVDPGTTHRSITRPQEHALALVDRYGFGKSHIFAQGFSLRRAVGEEAHIPAVDFHDLVEHHACDGVLDSLVTAGNTFDVALLDGNHDGDYLQAEVERLYSLLRSGGILILDDVEPDGIWVGVFEVFERTKSDGAFELLRADGRIALFRRT